MLAVPAQAVAFEEGHRICYVAHDDGLERREVKLGEGTEDFLEISHGLHEGEQVVLNPSLSDVQDDISEETPLAAETTLSAGRFLAASRARPAGGRVAISSDERNGGMGWPSSIWSLGFIVSG